MVQKNADRGNLWYTAGRVLVAITMVVMVLVVRVYLLYGTLMLTSGTHGSLLVVYWYCNGSNMLSALWFTLTLMQNFSYLIPFPQFMKYSVAIFNLMGSPY